MRTRIPRNRAPFVVLLLLTGGPPAVTQDSAGGIKEESTIYDFTLKTIDGEDRSLSVYRGTVTLVVNVASQCGYTGQYAGLESLYRTYKDRGFAILGFPANNFGGQEPGTNTEIRDFCTSRFDVTFDMFAKISVAGRDTHPLYRYLTSRQGKPGFTGEIRWNFTKILIDREGHVVGRFEPRIDPLSEEITAAVERALNTQ